MHLSHPPQELQRHPPCEQGMITQPPVRGLQELHTSPSYPDPLTTPQAQPLPSARISPQRVLIRLKSILPPSYTPLFPQQNPHPSPLVLKYSNALSTEYSQWLIWTIVFLLPVLSSNFVFSHSTSSDAWALQVWTLRQKQILYSDTQIFAGCTFPAIQPSICKQYVQIRCSKFMLLWSHMGKVQHCQLMYTVSYHNMNCKQLEGIVQLTASGQEVQTEKRLLLNANTE